MEKPKAKAKKKEFKRTPELAKPKKIVLPPKKKKPKKIFSAFKRLLVFAAPKQYAETKPKRVGVNPAALKCTASEHTIKLAQLPERWSNLPKPWIPGMVRRGALKYKITPRIEALSVPRPRSEKAKTGEDEGDPWTISPTALKYKPTPRILELAKPIERD